MAIAFKSLLGSANTKTAGTTLSITTTNPIAVGDFVVVTWASDNLASSGPNPVSVTDSGGNSYNKNLYDYSGGSAAGGVAGGIAYALATTAVSTGGTITLTLDGSPAARCMQAFSFTGVQNSGQRSNQYATISGTAISNALPSISAIGELCLCNIAVEDSGTPTYDTDTTDGSWSSGMRAGTSGGGAASNVYTAAQYKIVTGFNSQTWNLTVASTDTRSCVMVFPAAAAGPQGSGSASATHTVSATKGLIGHTGSASTTSTHTLSRSHQSNRFEAAPLTSQTHTVSVTAKRGGVGSAGTVTVTSTVSATGAKGPDAPVGSGSGSATSTSTIFVTSFRNSKGSDTETSTSTVSVTSRRTAARSASITSTHTLSQSFKPGHIQAAPTLTQTHVVTAIGGKPGGQGSGSGGVISTHTVSAAGFTWRFGYSSAIRSFSNVSVSAMRVAAKSAGITQATHTITRSHISRRFSNSILVTSTSSITVSGGKSASGSAGTVTSTHSISRAGRRTSYGSNYLTQTHTFTVTGRRFSAQPALTITAQHQVSSIGKRGGVGSAGVIQVTHTVFASNQVQPLVLNDAEAIYIGAIPAIRVYLGSEIVWEKP